MIGSAEATVDRYLELSRLKITSLKKVSTPCIDDHLLAPEDFQATGVLAPLASKIVLKALYLARIARPDLLWTVNSLAREVTKWTVACDKRLHRLISYIHHTKTHVMTAFIGDAPEDCHLMLYCDASFAGDLQDSKSTTGGLLCIVGEHTFVPISWMCKKHGAVSHSSSEAEIIALDAALRLEGIPAMTVWATIIEVFSKTPAKSNQQTVTPKEDPPRRKMLKEQCHLPADLRILSEVDYVPTNVPLKTGKISLIILEDNDAVIQMCIKGRSLNMRHVARTHRVDLDWLFELMLRDPCIKMKYINTKLQIADIFTKGSFTEQTWNVLIRLMQIQDSVAVEKGSME